MNSRSKFLGISGTTLHMDFIGHTSYPVVRKGVELREEGEERRGKRGGGLPQPESCPYQSISERSHMTTVEPNCIIIEPSQSHPFHFISDCLIALV